RPNKISELVSQKAEAPKTTAPKLDPTFAYGNTAWADNKLIALSSNGLTVEGSCSDGDGCLKGALAGEDVLERINLATKLYQTAVDLDSAANNLDGHLYFRLGVAYRMRYDQAESGKQNQNDFTLAAKYWSKALEVNPNQYIWRRRIQQYGPRLSKPYPFYDWVAQAKTEIKARGETPIKLKVPLAGAEIAQRERKFTVTEEVAANPDPNAKITVDSELVKIHATAVPQLIKPGEAIRAHVSFSLADAKWNNEADDMVVWIEPSKFGTVSKSRLSFPNPKDAQSTETRTVEFEFKTASSVSSSFELTGYALCYVCTNEGGQCIYRRQNFSFPVTVATKSR
ncbi:MAG: hypothetical protein AB8B55_09380, partial [Mariniblastus sp.]